MKIVEGRVRVAASDVANFLACQELTQLDLRAARRTLRPPHAVDLGFEELVRARAMAIIVASPDLIRVSCRTPHQMTLVNALCRAWEERE